MFSSVVFKRNIANIIFYDNISNIEVFNFEFKCTKYIEAFSNLIKHLNGETDKKTIHDKYDESGNSIWTIGDYDISINCEIDLIVNGNKVTLIGKVSDFPNEFRNSKYTTILNDSLIEVFNNIANYHCEFDDDDADNF